MSGADDGGAASAEDVARQHLARAEALTRLGAFAAFDPDYALRDARGVDADPERRRARSRGCRSR